MRQTQSPFGIERRLTPELFDHYVAKARAERAKAIAVFGGWIGRQLHRAINGIASRLRESWSSLILWRSRSPAAGGHAAHEVRMYRLSGLPRPRE